VVSGRCNYQLDWRLVLAASIREQMICLRLRKSRQQEKDQSHNRSENKQQLRAGL